MTGAEGFEVTRLAGALAIWDNRVTQHFVLNDFTEERVIQRVTVMGDRVEAAGEARWPAYLREGNVTDTSRHDALLQEWQRRLQEGSDS